MQRVVVESTTVGAAAHDAQTAVLELQFRNGAVYQYFLVPRPVYRDLLRAPSKGRYFHQNLRVPSSSPSVSRQSALVGSAIHMVA